MALQKHIHVPLSNSSSPSMAPLNFSSKVHEKGQFAEPEKAASPPLEPDVDIDLREVYFLIMHFLSAGPCHRTYGQFWNELLEHQLLPRRYHAWYSRSGAHSGDENDNGLSFPLNYNKLVERYPHIEKDHLVKLLKQLILTTAPPLHGMIGGNAPNAADVPTLLGSGSFSLLESDRNKDMQVNCLPRYLRWPHMQADQVRGLSLREIGGGFKKHHRAPSIRAACYAIAKPATMVQKMQNIKKLRGHRDAVYCAIFDRSGRYVITGSDDRLVKIWSMETAFCLASCRGHEGDITDLAVSSNNAVVASSSNDFVIRVWRLPDGMPVSTLRGHTGAVTAIAFSPRTGAAFQLLSSSDDGTCRIWDARNSNFSPRIYLPKPPDVIVGKNNAPSSSSGPQNHQILCCAFNASGTVFVTGSSDTYARVWNACKSNTDDSEQPNHEIDVLSGHENDVNYVQFSGCSVASKFSTTDISKEENIPKFKNSWFSHDNIVTCSRDGSAIIWVPRSRRSHGKAGRWTRAYHLKVPPPPMPPQPPRGGPRQRFLPTPRGVNMIVWSLDNRFVLAAIMDCRICVWNAADGSLVHSLTGHSESTYVLDVHPFNPRMAMSAGYDGKTILWDIWEGIPIRVYETGRFKLVDGKFSPDGTSIILSDEVGQIHILNTGQGESQKDAKYDQFFLGDYRPLMQDTHGNVVDQETQQNPYLRNMQDLLCDSSMIPYPEPYQSMYQQRRLGALNIEWRPPSIKYAVGADITLGLPDYQLLPLADLDRMIEPLPEFIDAMDWEPENEIQSDDTDSEYNVTDEYSSEGEQGSLNTSSSGDSACSVEDSDVEHSLKDSLRRSKRKKHKAEVEFTTSSGRRVKRRNLDECDGTLPRSNRSKKSRNGRKASRKKSSASKSLRPQRVAARNALNLFSRISGASTDGEDEENVENDSSESDSVLQDSNVQNYESDRSMQNLQQKHSKGKDTSLDDLDNVVKPPEASESQMNVGNRKRLVLKLPVRDSKKLIPPENTRSESGKHVDLMSSSSRFHQETTRANKTCVGSYDPGSSSGDAVESLQFQSSAGTKTRERTQSGRVDDHLELSAGYKENKIKWGEVKARSSKRFKFADAMAVDASLGSIVGFDGHARNENVNRFVKSEHDTSLPSEVQNHGDRIEGKIDDDGKDLTAINLESVDGARNKELGFPDYMHASSSFELGTCNGNASKESKDQLEFGDCKNYDDSLKGVDTTNDDQFESSLFSSQNGGEHSKEVKENPQSIHTKLRIRSKRILDPESSSKQKSAVGITDWESSRGELMSENILHMEQNINSGVAEEDEGALRDSHEDWHGLGKPDAHIDTGCSPSSLEDLGKLHSDSNNKMYNAVYKRSKSYRLTNCLEGDTGGLDESISNASNHNLDVKIDFPEAGPDGTRRTRSTGTKATTKEREGYGSVGTSKYVEKLTTNNREQIPCEDWMSGSKVTVGLRSSRNRRGNYDNDLNLSDKRKAHHSARKLSWLTLAEHEESYRYIPQLGDEVVYFRQGHQEYIESSRSAEVGPWRSFKGNIRAVEFCKVQGLDYSTLAGSGESCCKITLEFADPSSSEFGKRFRLTLPELINFPDFLVERTRYDSAIKRNWTHRDKCQVWWRNADEEGGSWWEGRVTVVKPKSLEFPDSPWERYLIQYKSDPANPHPHSPWELHDPDIPWEHPHIDYESSGKLLSLFAKLEQSANRSQDPYGIQKLKQVAQKSDYLNRFPVPLSLELVQSRLEHNYYRKLEAVKHDISVALSNAQSYFVRNAELAGKMRRLADWFTRALSSL
ncbi:PREDICTED: bromodomain and WD repeat-containing protein 1 [Nelumbo nucifera]|uniref:Bromodomain and WD repeat-containing protein 1 n=2 Tax=Nelumbo nucifera TaxID=4432 RepID=A0A1U7ZZK3_NELNU|nr:PREDICTED: bromodomain and WD repeat-containing protein 1 [Nelumbo nucifera]DAD38246.1 TPA_asm: hypothetical protein HUJ06_008887 [Nelumbo nucifera]